MVACSIFHINFYIPACEKRLARIIETGNRRGLVEPSIEEIFLSRRHIYEPSMFGASLEELHEIQKEKFPELDVPWIQACIILKLKK